MFPVLFLSLVIRNQVDEQLAQVDAYLSQVNEQLPSSICRKYGFACIQLCYFSPLKKEKIYILCNKALTLITIEFLTEHVHENTLQNELLMLTLQILAEWGHELDIFPGNHHQITLQTYSSLQVIRLNKLQH